MTWKYQINDNGELAVYDHNDELVTALQNDGSGFVLPNDIESIMRDEAEKSRANGNMNRWRDIHIRLADNDIAPKE